MITSCVEEFDLNIPEKQNKIVVDALITNEVGPYVVRLTKSKAGVLTINSNWETDPNYSEKDYAEAITSALVIISDNVGMVDTLIPAPLTIKSYQYNTDTITHQTDSIFVETENFQSIKYGFYNTTNIKGVAGRNYFLYIKYNKDIYTSSVTMPFVPEIDSVGIKTISNPIEGKSDISFPTVSFHEPQGQKNFYMFQLYDGKYITRSFSLWQLCIFDDSHLSEYVTNLNLTEGYNASGANNPLPYALTGGVYVKMSSLSETTYLFYKSLISQFYNDGGAYSSAPSSPKGNISNGALGLFRASAVSSKSKIINNKKPIN